MLYTSHTHNSFEMHPLQYCLHVLDLQVRKRSIAHFIAKSKPASRFKTDRIFKKDIQIHEKDSHRKFDSNIEF